MTRTPQETAYAIADYENMLGTLDYFTRDALGCLSPIDNETALRMVIDESATESLHDNGPKPFVVVLSKG